MFYVILKILIIVTRGMASADNDDIEGCEEEEEDQEDIMDAMFGERSGLLEVETSIEFDYLPICRGDRSKRQQLGSRSQLSV